MTGKALKKMFKRTSDRIRNEKLKQNLLQAIPFRVASLISGLIAVFYSRIFAFLESQTFSIIHYHAWPIFYFDSYLFYNCLVGW